MKKKIIFHRKNNDNSYDIIMKKISPNKIEQFQTMILDRYEQKGRVLPRRQSNNPYHVLICEIMSHQTQISRVITYWTSWIQDLPTIQGVAQLGTPDLLVRRQWLGYNNRALRLRETCRIISEDYNGIVPSDPVILMTLPGIGRYTAHAIASFAYDLPYPVLDTNIKRVWFHHYPETMNMKESDLIKFASQFIPQDQSKLWHSALMDYGAIELPMHRSNIRINAKQSPFRWSTRWVRSYSIKHCLTHGATQKQVLYDLYAKPRDYDQSQYEEIISKMITDGLITEQNNLINIVR